MKVWVPDVHDITVDILSSILLVDCDFLFPDYESELCDLAHKLIAFVIEWDFGFLMPMN